MLTITLPNKDKKNYKSPVTALQIATEISPRLASDAFVAEVNGELWDLNRLINNDSTVSILTSKNNETLDLIRHDAAHIMAEAVLEIFPETQVTIGPSIENGFYYDFFREKKFNLSDLEIIEKRMHEIVDRDEKITREVWTRKQALDFFKKNNENFKVELVNAIPENETVTFYRQGNFIDLCRGPHAPSTKKLGHSFKLTKLAGSYWRGDSKNAVLQRIYGTAFLNDKDLKNYLLMIEEAEKRDHRKIGKELNLFHLQEEAVGSVFWHKKGWSIYLEIEAYMRRKLKKSYEEVKTPQVIDRSLWEKSGHWDKFQEHMFMAKGDDEKTLALKPMNCPGHVQIYKQGLKSYKDLPIRMSEFGSCHRNEPSGALHGIMRVRQFTQDDAHIFCMPNQWDEEFKKVIDLVLYVFSSLGFEEFTAQVSLRDPKKPEKYIGSTENWELAEQAILNATKEKNLDFVVETGEAAFYGPKLDFMVKDALGRQWQLGTIQVDYNLPERFDLNYKGSDNELHRPVMIHRAPFGSMERFVAILLEHTRGNFPLWLMPNQVNILCVSEKYKNYALKVLSFLENHEIRALLDDRNETIGKKIRESEITKVPYMIILGEKEATENNVSLRKHHQGDLGSFTLETVVEKLTNEIKSSQATFKV